MIDDPRLKRVLKRYGKSEEQFNASLDVTLLGLAQLRKALGCTEDDPLIAPHALDAQGASRLSRVLGIPLDTNEFDYFLHSYVRAECVAEYDADPTVGLLAPPEDGRPAKVPLPAGMRWLAVRPRDGKERFIGVRDTDR